MKKEKSLIFPCSRWLMVVFLALGMTFLSNTNVVAQSVTPLDDAISAMTQTRNSFAPGSAKHDFAQAAIDYLVNLDAAILANPEHVNDIFDQFGTDVYQAAPLRRAHPTILANYSAAELASFQVQINDGTVSPASVQKLQWILDANAY